MTSSMRSSSAIDSRGARSATKKATTVSTRKGTRSQTVHRSTKGSLRSSRSVWAAAKSGGRNHPTVMTAGMAPMITVDAPSEAAKAGKTVAEDTKASPTMNRP